MGSNASSISRGKTESDPMVFISPLISSAKASPVPETDVSSASPAVSRSDSAGRRRRMERCTANISNASAHTKDLLNQVSDYGSGTIERIQKGATTSMDRHGGASAHELAALPLMEHIWFTVAMNGFEAISWPSDSEGNESFFTCEESMSCSSLGTFHTSMEDMSPGPPRRNPLLHPSHPIAPPPVPPTLLSLCNVMPRSKLSEVLLPVHPRSPVLPFPAEQVPLMQCSLVPPLASLSSSSLRSLSSASSFRSLSSACAVSPGSRSSEDAPCDEENVQMMTRLEIAISRTGMRLQQAVREHERRERQNDSLLCSPTAQAAPEEGLSAGSFGLGLVLQSPTSTTLSSFTVWDADAVEESEFGYEVPGLDAGAGAGLEQPLLGLGLADFAQSTLESSGSISRLVGPHTGQSDTVDYSNTPGAAAFGYVEHAGIEPSGVLPDVPCLAPRTFEPGVENWLLSITELEPLPPLNDELEESTSPVAKLTDLVPPKPIEPLGVLSASLSPGTETKEIIEPLRARSGAGASAVAGAVLFRGVRLGGVDRDAVVQGVPLHGAICAQADPAPPVARPGPERRRLLTARNLAHSLLSKPLFLFVCFSGLLFLYLIPCVRFLTGSYGVALPSALGTTSYSLYVITD